MICRAVFMLTAIDLNNQTHFQAHKIEHIVQEGMLTAELKARDLPSA